MLHLPARTLLAILTLVALAACKSDGEEPLAPDVQPDPEPISGFHFQIENPEIPQIVDQRLAGANYLHTRDRVEGTFGPRAEELGVTYLRWPGGAIAEDEIPYHQTYLTDGHTKDWQQFSHEETWSLENVSEYAEDHDMSLMVVLPTKKYVLSPGVIDESTIRQEIGPFVRELTRGRFGPVPDLIEIGNEFYWGSDQIEAEDYTAVAKVILDEIRTNQSSHINVAVQAGRLGQGMIGRVAAGFTSSEKSQIDFIADHIYTRNFDWTNYDDRFRMYRNNWGDKPALISEWNVKSTKDGDLEVYAWGIEQAAPLVRVWDSMVRENTRAATFWAVQQNTMTAAFPNEGDDPETDMYIGGKTFQWLASTVGMARQDVIQLGQDGIGAFAYRKNNKIIAFLAGLDAGEQQVTLTVPDHQVLTARGIRMSGEIDIRKQIPQLEDITPAINGTKVQVTINKRSDHELLKIELQLAD